MADRVWKGVQSQVIGPSDQLSLHKFFDSIIPSMKTSKIQNGHQGASKWPMGSGKWFTLRFLGTPLNFCLISYLIRALLLWEKVATAAEEKKKKKITAEIVATNFIASRPPNGHRLQHQPLASIKVNFNSKKPMEIIRIQELEPSMNFLRGGPPHLYS